MEKPHIWGPGGLFGRGPVSFYSLQAQAGIQEPWYWFNLQPSGGWTPGCQSTQSA